MSVSDKNGYFIVEVILTMTCLRNIDKFGSRNETLSSIDC